MKDPKERHLPLTDRGQDESGRRGSGSRKLCRQLAGRHLVLVSPSYHESHE